MTVSEQALGPLDPLDPAVLAPPTSADLALSEIREQICELEDELRDLERRTEAAERRLADDDPTSAFVRRAADLGHSLALDIVHKGRRDIRNLLAEARSAAEARTAGALCEAHEVLASARAEVADALRDRAADVEAVLTGLAPVAPTELAGPSVAVEPPVTSSSRVDAPVSVGPAVTDAPTPVMISAPSGRDPLSVMAMLEASNAESVAVPLGSPVDARPVMVSRASSSAHPAKVPDAAILVATSTRIPVGLPDPPDVAGAGFADLAESDPSDPFVGDTPATTSEHIGALADLEAPAGTVSSSSTEAESTDVTPRPEGVAAESGGGAGSDVDAETAIDAVPDAVPGEGFWGEQEAARRQRWRRPVEIFVPMALALVFFVVLLLWVG